jgi:hypothetical protein
MMRDRFEPPKPWRTLLDLERPIPSLPAFTRARAIARARDAIGNPPQAPLVMRAAGIPRWTLPLAIAGASLATFGVAHHIDSAAQPPVRLVVADAPLGMATNSKPRAWGSLEPEASAASDETSGARDGLARRAPRASAPSPGELLLLQGARAALAASDFATARNALLEHARRFPSGQLTEEREALRVKTLLGLGRPQEARQAARAFEARFPDSVLGPAVSSLTLAP